MEVSKSYEHKKALTHAAMQYMKYVEFDGGSSGRRYLDRLHKMHFGTKRSGTWDHDYTIDDAEEIRRITYEGWLNHVLYFTERHFPIPFKEIKWTKVKLGVRNGKKLKIVNRL